MTAIRKSGALAALAWEGKIVDPRDQAFADALATRRFRTIENAASEEVSAGWVTAGDPTGDSFDLEDLDGGVGTWLRMRIDRKAMPTKWLQHHRDVAEKARGRKLSARERRELKDDLAEQLLPRVLPTTAHVDALLFHDRRLVLLFASSKGARETFGKLFFESFGAPANSMGPIGFAVAGASDISNRAFTQLQPMRWPSKPNPANPLASPDVKITVRSEGNPLIDEVADQLERDGVNVEREGKPATKAGEQKQFGFADGFEFLGEEFLLWLWFRWETEGGEFTLRGGRVVGIAIDDLIVFTPRSEDETQQTLRRGLPTRTAEARTALRQGHRVAKARLLIAEGSRQWEGTLDGATLRFAGTKLPEDAEECEADVDRTADRSANWLALHEIAVALFGVFVRVRTGGEWKREAGRMATWMSQ